MYPTYRHDKYDKYFGDEKKCKNVMKILESTQIMLPGQKQIGNEHSGVHQE